MNGAPNKSFKEVLMQVKQLLVCATAEANRKLGSTTLAAYILPLFIIISKFQSGYSVFYAISYLIISMEGSFNKHRDIQ